jgi:hypothetical protein
VALAGVVKTSAPSQRFVQAHFVEENDSPVLKGFDDCLALKLWTDNTGQDIAEYAVMLAVISVVGHYSSRWRECE